MLIDLRTADALSVSDRQAMDALGAAVYSEQQVAQWPGRSMEWSAPQWRVITWDDGGQAVSHIGALLRTGLADGHDVRIGGIGGVMTHPQTRRQGLVRHAIQRTMDLFREQHVDFALLVCEPQLIPFYERLGWTLHAGELIVTQRGEQVRFTFNRPMLQPVTATGLLSIRMIDLLGPPW